MTNLLIFLSLVFNLASRFSLKNPIEKSSECFAASNVLTVIKSLIVIAGRAPAPAPAGVAK